MTLRSKLIPLFCTGILAVVLGSVSFAQQADQERERAKDAQATMVTGCLTKAADQYVITDSKSGTAMTLSGADLDKHANHTVTVTGTPSADGKSIAVTKVEHVADTCPAAK